MAQFVLLNSWRLIIKTPVGISFLFTLHHHQVSKGRFKERRHCSNSLGHLCCDDTLKLKLLFVSVSLEPLSSWFPACCITAGFICVSQSVTSFPGILKPFHPVFVSCPPADCLVYEDHVGGNMQAAKPSWSNSFLDPRGCLESVCFTVLNVIYSCWTLVTCSLKPHLIQSLCLVGGKRCFWTCLSVTSRQKP